MNKEIAWKRFIIGFSIGLMTAPLASTQLDMDTLIAKIPTKATALLNAEGTAFRYDSAKLGMQLAPQHPSLEILKQINRGLNPDVMVEGIYLIPYPQGSDGIDLHLYNITRRVSEIVQVRYLSARKKKVVPLFNDVYRVENTRSRRPLPDPIVNDIPRSDTIILYMEEVILGGGYYETTYAYDGESLSLSLNNISTLRHFIKVVDREDMEMHIMIFQTDRGFLVYSYCGVVLANHNLVFRVMDPYSAFYKRLYSLVLWVNNSLHDTDKQPVIGKELDF